MAAARLDFNSPKTAHARIKLKTSTLAYKTATKAAPAYLNSLVQVYAPSRSLYSAKEGSREFNELPNHVQLAQFLSVFKRSLKTEDPPHPIRLYLCLMTLVHVVLS